MIKACIFDLDGVLCDTAKYHYLAWKRLADELGFVFTEKDNERLKGVSRMESLEILLEVGNITAGEEQKEEWARKKNGWYVEYLKSMDQEALLPGAKEMLLLARRDGMKTALGSASKNAGLILDRLGLAPYFDAIADGNLVERAKPAPDVFLAGARLTQTPPQDCLVFEDSQAGIAAARAGRMASVGVGDKKILGEADFVVASLVELTGPDGTGTGLWRKISAGVSV